MSSEGVFIYIFNQRIGPLEWWEIKLIASKYRDFFVWNGCEWVSYKKHTCSHAKFSLMCTMREPASDPAVRNIFFVRLFRFIKRSLLKDHH